MNGYFCVLTIIDFFILCFMCILTYLSESLSRKQKRGFLLAFVLIAGISILEVITLVVDGLPPAYRWLNVASNYMGFGLSPAVCICLVYVLDRKTVFRRKIRTAILFEIGYLIFLFVTIPYGIVFSVSADNIYSRGPHFYIYIIMYFGAILYLSVSTIINAREFQNRSKLLIYPLFLFVMAETIIQVVLPKLHVTWLCITLLSVFACGFMAVSRYHIKMALKNRAYMEARLTTHMIHNSFCEAVSKGESDALRLLWNQYEGDLEDEEAEENENEDIPETEGAGADGITKLDADEIQDTNERQDADERQDTDLDLEDREYITEGTGSYTDEKGEPCEVRIRLKLEPVEEKAYVDTWTKISGFSMHLEGEVPLQDTP